MKINVELAPYEIHALISWHHDREYEAANKQEYADAEEHKRRQKELHDLLAANKID